MPVEIADLTDEALAKIRLDLETVDHPHITWVKAWASDYLAAVLEIQRRRAASAPALDPRVEEGPRG